MRKLGLALCLLVGLAPAHAQQVSWPPPAGSVAAICVYNSSPPAITDLAPGFVQCDANGNLRVAGSLTVTGTTSNATSGVATSSTNSPVVSYTYGFNGTTWDQLQVDGSKFLKVIGQTGSTTAATQATAANLNATVVGTGTLVTQATPTATATGGATQFSIVAANSNNSTSVKGSAGTVYSVQLSGIGAAPAYLKFYDKATAPTCASDAVVGQFIIPANATAALGAGSNISIPVGKAFTLGIGICVVTGIAVTDNTSVAAATFVINIDYK